MPSKNLLVPHRTTYEVMKRVIEAAGYTLNNEAAARKGSTKNIRASQSLLWSQIPLDPNNSSYVFNVKAGIPNQGNGGVLPAEVRLKEQNVFFCYAMGFYLQAYLSPSGSTDFRNKLMSFPSADFFGPAPALVPGLFTMSGLWNFGRMEYQVNGETITPDWDMSQHLVVPQTQLPTPFSGNPAWDQIEMGDYGKVVVEPNWIINGSNDNQFTLNYGNNFSGIRFGTDWKWQLVTIWQGFLAQNCSTIMDPGGIK